MRDGVNVLRPRTETVPEPQPWPEPFDPAMFTVTGVKRYVTENPDQREAVRAAELEGKRRSSLLDWLGNDEEMV
jgi:hypothetical protein